MNGIIWWCGKDMKGKPITPAHLHKGIKGRYSDRVRETFSYKFLF